MASARLELQDVLIGQGYDPDNIEAVPADVMNLARLRSGLRQAELTLSATQKDVQEPLSPLP